VTPLIHQQPVQDMEYMADGVRGQLFTGCNDRVFQCYFVQVVVGEVMKLNTQNNTRALPAATSTRYCNFNACEVLSHHTTSDQSDPYDWE